MNKDLIKKRFGKNLKYYNENAKIQKKMAEKLISMLPTKNFNNVLEIGCGSGLLTEIAVESIEYNYYCANDIVDSCEEIIKSINSDIEFLSGDMEKCISSTNMHFDLIISNASFQWADDLAEFTEKVTEKLVSGGILLFSTFGTENYREITHFLDKNLKYYSKYNLLDLLSKHNPEIEEEIHVMAFKTPTEVLKHMKYTGVNAIDEKHWTKKDIKNFENVYNNFCSYSPTLTYNPIYIKIIKNSKIG